MDRHDVFISFSHADDDPPLDEQYGWVSTFVSELRKILKRRIGGDGADIWIDHQLASNEKVTDTLRERVRSSRTLVLFLSNGYLRSNWCRYEINQFLDENRTHKNKESVFIVELDEVPRESWPSRLRELTPIRLYKKDQEKGSVALLGFPKPTYDERGSPYWTRLNDLAHWIYEHLRLLKTLEDGDQLLKAAAGQTPPGPDRRSRIVWLAQPPGALAEQWESTASALRQHGATVLPVGRSTYPTADEGEFRSAVERDLAKASLFVQILGEAPGVAIGTGKESACSLQATLARHRQQRMPAVSFLQWRSLGVDLDKVADSAHRALLQGTISCGFETFRQMVLETFLTEPRPETSTVKPIRDSGNSNPESLTFCITAGARDEELGADVSRIVAGLGHSALPAPPNPERGQLPSDYRTSFENLLAEVDGVILVHGGESPIWIQSRYAQLRKAFALRKQGIWGAYVDGPPPDKPTSTYFDPNVAGIMRLDCRNGVSERPIADFISQCAVSHA